MDTREWFQYRQMARDSRRMLNDLRRWGRERPADLLWELMVVVTHFEKETEWLLREAGMPTKKRDDTGWVGFVDVTLSSREKEAFQAWDVEGEDLWTLLVDTLVSGHKLSVSYNRANDTFGAAFTGNGEDTANKGYTLSAYGADWYTAVRVLLFKHVVLLEGVWANAKGREGERIG